MKTANRKFGRLLSVVLVLLLALPMAMPAFAAPDGNDKIIINAPKGEPGENNRFVAYQIFAGTPEEKENELSVTGWGSGVKILELITALKTDTSTVPDVDGSTKFGEQFTKAYEKYQAEFDGQLTKAAFVAEWLGKVSEGITGRTDANPYADAFARIVAKCLKEDGKKESTKQENGNNVQWTISPVDPGYYLVRDTYKGTDASVSSYILTLPQQNTIDIKASIPTVDKDVVDDHGHMSDGAIARPFEAMTYTITGTIAKNIDEYTTYKYIFNDTLSSGLDLVKYDPEKAGNGDTATALAATADGADVKASANIKLYLYNGPTKPADLKTVTDAATNGTNGSKELQGSWTATYKTGDNGKKVLTVTIDDLKALAGADLNANSKIVLVYAAMMNKDAVIGSAGNPNDATITYSNDPYTEDTGTTTPDEPKIYTVGFNLNKTDGSNGDSPLEGAAFKLKRWNWTGIPGETGNGEEWNKVDGSFQGKIEWAIVETDPTGGPDETPKYVIKGWTENEQQATEMATGTGGKLQIVGIRGLGVQHEAGTDHVYKSNFALVESTVPSGYQKMKDIIFNVQLTVGVDGLLKNATIKIHESNEHREDIKFMNLNGSLMNGENLATLQVRNFKSPLLPFTGGIGTVIFYVAGGLLVVGAVTYLVIASKKRKKAEENA